MMSTIESSYSKIVKNVVAVEKPKKNPIQSGWVQVSFNNNNQIIYNYGDPTPNMIKRSKQEEINNNFHINATKVFDKMIDKWTDYENLYDEINGENAYAEKYRLPPVYNEDDDEDDENEEDNDDEINNILEDDNIKT